MDSSCVQCSKSVKSLDFIKCHFCEHTAHTKCIGWTRANLDFVNNQSPNLSWFCNDCVSALDQLKARNSSLTTVNLVSTVSDCVNDCLKEFKLELDKTNCALQALSDQFNTSSAAKPASNRLTGKRPRDTGYKTTPSGRPTSALLGGTRKVSDAVKVVDTVPKPVDKFWLYLSRIAPHVTEEDVAAMVQECVTGSEPVVKKLVKKDADLSSFAFVSFKVGVDRELKDNALDPSIWPNGIFFREFDDRRKKEDFWKPKAPKVPRIEALLQSLVTPEMLGSPME